MLRKVALAVAVSLLVGVSAAGAGRTASPPANTSSPTISGTAKSGNTLTATSGTWANSPTSYDYQWKRCDASGGDCHSVGAAKNTYLLQAGDVGSTMRILVKAKNSAGSAKATSAQTAVVTAGGSAPANTALPSVSGAVQTGSTLTASVGTWSNSPTTYAYQWKRCDGSGNSCADTGAAQTQKLVSGDAGHTIRVTVTASNQFGSGKATSNPTVVVPGASLPGGAIKLPNGQISLPVDQVSLPNLLVVSAVQFTPSRLTSRSPFVARFRIGDLHGNVIRGALVYAIGVPYGWVRPASEVTSATDGWATIQFIPTSAMPLRRSALVFFVRARKPGDNLLSGVSARRLVQLGIG